MHRGKFAIIALTFVVAVILFPIEWLAEVWHGFGRVLFSVFPTQQSHIFGHATLYFCFGMVVLLTFPNLKKHFWRYALLVLMVGFAQEVLQAVTRPEMEIDYLDSFSDLLVDLGGATAFLLVRLALSLFWPRKRNSLPEISPK